MEELPVDHPVQHTELSCLKYTFEEAVMQPSKTVAMIQTNAKQKHHYCMTMT